MKSLIRRYRKLKKRFVPESECPTFDVYLTHDTAGTKPNDHGEAVLISESNNYGLRCRIFEYPEPSKNEESKVT